MLKQQPWTPEVGQKVDWEVLVLAIQHLEQSSWRMWCELFVWHCFWTTSKQGQPAQNAWSSGLAIWLLVLVSQRMVIAHNIPQPTRHAWPLSLGSLSVASLSMMLGHEYGWYEGHGDTQKTVRWSYDTICYKLYVTSYSSCWFITLQKLPVRLWARQIPRKINQFGYV